MSPRSIVDAIPGVSNSSGTRPVQYSHCDVLVVGAGPSGLMVAQALARLGIQVRVIERRLVKTCCYDICRFFIDRELMPGYRARSMAMQMVYNHGLSRFGRLTACLEKLEPKVPACELW